MEDYCGRTNAGQIYLGLKHVNHVTFDIQNSALSGLRDNPFDEQDIRDLWEHLACFYEKLLMWKPNGVTNDHIKLTLL